MTLKVSPKEYEPKKEWKESIESNNMETTIKLFPTLDQQNKEWGLIESSRLGFIESVKYLIVGGKLNLNCQDSDFKRTPIYRACWGGKFEVVKYLHSKGADFSIKQIEGATCLFISAQQGHLEIVKYLVENGAKSQIDQPDNIAITPLLMTSQQGHLEIVKYLVSVGCDINHQDNEGRTAIWNASFYGHLEIVKYLVEHGAKSQIDQPDYDGLTPLLITSQEGHLEIVKYLVENGAKINQPDNDGSIPLLITSEQGHLEVVKYLVENGAKSQIDQQDNNGTTPFIATCAQGHLEIIKYLVENGCDINHQDNEGRTAIWKASYNGHLEVLKYLISIGSDWSLGPINSTPLQIAEKKKHTSIANYLKSIKSNEIGTLRKLMLQSGISIEKVKQEFQLIREDLKSTQHELENSRKQLENSKKELEKFEGTIQVISTELENTKANCMNISSERDRYKSILDRIECEKERKKQEDQKNSLKPFLKSINLSQFVGKFESQSVSMKILETMNEKELNSFGLNFGEARAIVLAIQERKNIAQNSEPSNSTNNFPDMLIERKKLTQGKLIGHGSFGDVFEAIWNGKTVAMKVVRTVGKISEKVSKSFKSEAQLLWKLRHPHIVQLFGVVDSDPYCLIMELAGESLHSLLASNETLEWSTRYNFALEIAQGMHHLHSENILHRDLKAANVLLTKHREVKLADFGLAKIKEDFHSNNDSSSVGTLAWIAPELFDVDGTSSKESDIYSFGMVCFEIASRTTPWSKIKTLSIQTVVLEGKRPEIPKETPKSFSSLIQSCWNQEIELRPSFQTIVNSLNKLANKTEPKSSLNGNHKTNNNNNHGKEEIDSEGYGYLNPND